MFYSRINYIHYELTDICNARCPQCQRTDPLTGKTADFITKQQQSLEDFKRILEPADLKLIDEIHFCGTFGDPIACRDLLEICEYIWQHNKELFVFISTNGSLRNEDWWFKLGGLNSQKLIVHFAIEGLDQETHEFYRRHTNLERIMHNAEAFIDGGGRAEWQYIVFKHNEHQVEEARELSNKLGFEKFNMVVSDRFHLNNTFNYRIDGKEYKLEQTLKYRNTEGKSTTHGVKETSNCIDCFAFARKEAYVSVHGVCYPCCFIAEPSYAILHDPLNNNNDHVKTRRQLGDIIRDNTSSLNLYNNNIFDVVNGEFFQNILPDMWKRNEPVPCYKVCGTKKIEKITVESC